MKFGLSIIQSTVDVEIFTVKLFSLYSRLVNNCEIKLTLIIQRQLQYYSISAAIVKIKYAKQLSSARTTYYREN